MASYSKKLVTLRAKWHDVLKECIVDIADWGSLPRIALWMTDGKSIAWEDHAVAGKTLEDAMLRLVKKAEEYLTEKYGER